MQSSLIGCSATMVHLGTPQLDNRLRTRGRQHGHRRMSCYGGHIPVISMQHIDQLATLSVPDEDPAVIRTRHHKGISASHQTQLRMQTGVRH